MKIASSIIDLVGKTPMVRLERIDPSIGGNLVAKLESFNPLHSIKDRIGIAIIESAERDGSLEKGGTIIEATSGNTGIALALAGALKGYKVVIVMPESMSAERKKILSSLGARVELTPASEGMAGSVQKSEELAKSIPGAFLARQFENPANPKTHYDTTAEEIWADTGAERGKIGLFVAGIGTGGTITGISRKLKELDPSIKIIGVEPSESPLVTEGRAGPHAIQGIGANFIPKILDLSLVEEVVTVSSADAVKTSRALAMREGIVSGFSSGANVFAAIEAAKRLGVSDKLVVTVICDSGERYLSTSLFGD